MPRLAKAASLLLLAGCLAIFLLGTRHWPPISDGVLMQYVVFLAAHGMAPYRDIVDPNMPGAYLLAALIAHLPGPVNLAFRLADLLSLALAALALFALGGPGGRYPALVAAAVFALLHGADGVAEMNQRDFVMAVLSLLGTAAFLRALPPKAPRAEQVSMEARPQSICTKFLNFMKRHPERSEGPAFIPPIRREQQVLPAQSALRRSAPQNDASMQTSHTPSHSRSATNFQQCLAGLCWGAAATLKPQIALLPAFILLLAMRRRFFSAMLRAGMFFLLPPLAVLLSLYRRHSLRAFLHTAAGLVPFHASMARRSLPFLAGHAVTSPVLPLLAAAAVLLAAQRGWRTLREQALLAGILTGFLSYALQGKGYPYHRYTLLLFLLAYLASQLERALAAPDPRWRAVAVAALAYVVLWLAPASAARALRYDYRTAPSLDALARDLQREEAGSSPGTQVQCMDTMAGCITALSRLDLVQSTGFLYDCYFFAPTATASQAAVQTELRRQFWQQITAHPPLLFVITDQWCLNGPGGYAKLAAWPQFAQLLGEQYTLREEEVAPAGSYRRLAAWPFGYRIYRRNSVNNIDVLSK